MRSERQQLLGGNLLTSLSIALEVSPYRIIISKDSMEVDPAKIRGVTDWPEPSDRQDV